MCWRRWKDKEEFEIGETLETGVAKAAFSARDLTDARFEFDDSSISRMRPSVVAGASDSDTSDTAGR